MGKITIRGIVPYVKNKTIRIYKKGEDAFDAFLVRAMEKHHGTDDESVAKRITAVANVSSKDEQNITIREELCYDTIDIAAMAAANEIYNISSKEDCEVEYGIAIYKKDNKFYLTDMRKGTAEYVDTDHKLGMPLKPHKGQFVAHVHSHPLKMTDITKENFQMFSSRDYLAAYYGRQEYAYQFIVYLVAHLNHVSCDVAATSFIPCTHLQVSQKGKCRRENVKCSNKNSKSKALKLEEIKAFDGTTSIIIKNGILMKFEPPLRTDANKQLWLNFNKLAEKEKRINNDDKILDSGRRSIWLFRDLGKFVENNTLNIENIKKRSKPGIEVTPIIKIEPNYTKDSIVWKEMVYPYYIVYD